MEAQLCEYTNNHQIVHFERVNCVVCESHLGKAVKKQNKIKETSDNTKC